MKSEQEDLDDIIQDILDEDATPPKFSEVNEQKNGAESDAAKKKVRVEKKAKADKKSTKTSKPENKSASMSKKTKYAEMAIMVTRYVTLASVILFFISLFFTWFSLSGNTVNYGYIRGEETTVYMDASVQEYKVEQLVKWDKTLVSFSGNDLRKFGDVMEEDYLTVIGPDDEETNTIAAKIHGYYTKAMILVFIFTGIAALILGIFRRHTGIVIVRNLAVFNGIIIGLNYMALKIPYFSMFAIRAKDVLNQSVSHITLSMTKDGIALDDVFYPYVLTEERGLYIAAFFLGLWLFLSIILTEVGNREKELAIENGEMK